MNNSGITYIGPFSEIVTMDGLPANGPISDDQLNIIEDGFIAIKDGMILGIVKRESINLHTNPELHILKEPSVCLPGFIDAHTHICFAGSRARDYAMRNAGKTYLEIAKEGGGILSTVNQTRIAKKEELIEGILKRTRRHLESGVTTIEIKSGYGLNSFDELKMLTAIQDANDATKSDLISTCLAAHTVPPEFKGKADEYIQFLNNELLPLIKEKELSNRVDIFVEKGAFTVDQAWTYLLRARDLGYDITVHADQFSTGGSKLAVEMGALSADHLEASGIKEVKLIAESETVAVALPGASLGLGCNFTPARSILDHGGRLAIASDWNPGSAPMGYLLMQAAILGTFQKLTNAEILAGITVQAANALNLKDRGIIKSGFLADLVIFPTHDYREILYKQGMLRPSHVLKRGEILF
ncbi:MAG: imidazolonepropionase [Saprospiraceae bacterium]|nr:imidazolonepropionase [Saprospiraceae bacterium]